MATVDLKDATGATFTTGKYLPGSAADAASLPVTQSTEDKAVLAAMSAKLPASLGIKGDAASFSVTKSTEDRVVSATTNTLLGVKTTSVTALETGGVGIIGWLSQIWRDLISTREATRTAVNLVAGEVGVAAGTGAITANTPRFEIANDSLLLADNDQFNWGFSVAVAPTVTNGAYAAGDIVGALLNFADVARIADESIVITSVVVALKAAVTSNLRLVLFNADPTATTKTDNAAYSLNAADVFKVIDDLSGFTLADHGTPNTYVVRGLSIACKPVSGARNIYGLLIDGTGFTLTSTSDVQITLRGLGA